MGTEPGGGIHEDQGFEHFPRMDERQGQGADRHHIETDHAMLPIEATHDELLPVQALKAGPEQCGSRCRVMDRVGRSRPCRVADERDPIPRSPIRLRWPDDCRWPAGGCGASTMHSVC